MQFFSFPGTVVYKLHCMTQGLNSRALRMILQLIHFNRDLFMIDVWYSLIFSRDNSDKYFQQLSQWKLEFVQRFQTPTGAFLNEALSCFFCTLPTVGYHEKMAHHWLCHDGFRRKEDIYSHLSKLIFSNNKIILLP